MQEVIGSTPIFSTRAVVILTTAFFILFLPLWGLGRAHEEGAEFLRNYRHKKGQGFSLQATHPCPFLCPCFAGLRPRAPNTAVLTLRYGCGDYYAHCSPMAALYRIPASSQLKLRPSTPMGVQETKWSWFASNPSLPFIVSLLRRPAPSRSEYRRAHLKVRLRG